MWFMRGANLFASQDTSDLVSGLGSLVAADDANDFRGSAAQGNAGRAWVRSLHPKSASTAGNRNNPVAVGDRVVYSRVTSGQG